MKRAASAGRGSGVAIARSGAAGLSLVAFGTFVASALSATTVQAAGEPLAQVVPAGAVTVVLIVRADDWALDRQALRRAIQDEIAAPVILDGDAAATGVPRRWLTVGLDMARKELAVSFEEVGRETVTRVVPAAPDGGTLIRRAAWLAGNLLRDEASELLPRHVAAEPPPPAPLQLEPPVVVTVAPAPPPRHVSPVTAALFFPLATNFDAPDVHTRLDLNLLYGRAVAPRTEAPTDPEVVYGQAHDAHFVRRDYEAALAAWDRYLALPSAPLTVEARYNRAIALVRLQRRAEAAEALEPFAAGHYGGYRREEARALLSALRTERPVRPAVGDGS